ncbi:MAG: hypothetical protein IBX72_03925 [Nitrospirae bacterium]|nr:hypothetical protein [Nitrospirota bacterium]
MNNPNNPLQWEDVTEQIRPRRTPDVLKGPDVANEALKPETTPSNPLEWEDFTPQIMKSRAPVVSPGPTGQVSSNALSWPDVTQEFLPSRSPTKQPEQISPESTLPVRETLKKTGEAVMRPFKAQAAKVGEAFHRGMAGFTKGLTDVADYVGEKTGLYELGENVGIPRSSGILQKAIKTYSEKSEHWHKRSEEIGTNVIDELLGEAVGGAVPGVTEFALNVPYAALRGAAEAEKQGRSEITGALTEGAKRALLGQIFHAGNLMKQPYSTLATGTAFGAQAASEGAGPEEIAKSAGTGLLYGLLHRGGKLGPRDVIEGVKETFPMRYREILDKKAHEAATSPLNIRPEPTEAQKEAGNYKKGHIAIQGLDISIENPKGSTRSGVTAEGRKWETEVKSHYGYIRGTKGKDKDHIDTFIGEHPESKNVFVVNQIDPKTGKFDEHKVMLGFQTENDARIGYLENYEPGWKGLGSITPMSVKEFKDWSREGERKAEPVKTEATITEPEITRPPKYRAEVTPTEGEIPPHIERAVQEPRKVPVEVAVQTKQLTKDTLNESFASGIINPAQPIRLTTVDELRDIIKRGVLREGRDFEGRAGISAQLAGGKKPIVAYGANDRISAAIIFPEGAVEGRGMQPNEVKINPAISPEQLRFVIDGYRELLTFEDLKRIVEGREKVTVPEFAPEEGFRRPVEPELPEGEPVKRSDIVNFLQEKLDVPIRTGRFTGQGRGVLGIFKPKEEVVRTKFANDIETMAHEVGHGLQKFLFPESVTRRGYTEEIFSAFKDELEPIATKPRPGQPKTTEGFAEFIRLYVTNEKKAREKAPRFFEHFENILNEKSPEARDILLEARSNFNRWVKQPSLARVLGQISTGEQRKRPTTFNDLYTATVDDLHPLKKMVQEMARGEELPMSKDPYKLARLYRGWWGKADAFLEYRPFDYNTYAWKGKPLREILPPLKDNLDEFRAYVISKRSIELHERGKETGILKRDAKKIVSDYEQKFGKAFDDLKEYQDLTLKYLRDSNVLSTRDYLKIKQLNRDYVPFYRVMETEKRGGLGKGFQAYQPIKGIKGSWRDIVDPLESVIKNTYLFINAAERNAIGKALVDLAGSKQGLGKYVEKIPLSKQKITVKISEVIEDPFMKELFKNTGLSEQTASIFRPSAFQPKDNVISVWNKGRREIYRVHPEIARTMQAVDKEQMNTIVKIMSYPARWLRAGATLAPEFSVRNPIRDNFTAFTYSKYGFKPGVDFIKGLFNVTNKSDLYWQWTKAGGQHAMLVSMDREYLRKNLDAVIRGKGPFSPETYKNIIKNPMEALRILSEFGEKGTRVGEFLRGVRKEGLTKEGLQKAAFASREVTLDFARIGAKTKAVNSLIAFWNANVQGFDKMVRAFKENPVTSTFRAMAAITLPSIILTVINRRDERWKEIPQWQKDLFWIIMTEDHIWRIPKPFELGILFGTVPERITEYILDNDPRAFNGILKAIGQGASPGVIPTVAVPLLENWANKSFFLDRPIVSRGKEKLMPEYQYQPYTTEIGKRLGRMIGRIPGIGETAAASPAKIENLIRGWSGGLGMHILKAADTGLKKAGVLPEEVKPSRTLSDIPFIKAFAVRHPSAGAESIQRFYDNYEKASQTLSTARELIREGKREEAGELLNLGKKYKLDQHYKSLSNAHQLIDKVYANPELTSEEKRKLIDEIYLSMIRIARHGNKLLERHE